MFLRTQERIAAERGDLGAHSVGGAVSDDLKFWVAPTWWRVNRDRVWGAIFIGCLLVASFIPNNAERQEVARQTETMNLKPSAISTMWERGAPGTSRPLASNDGFPVVSAPYLPCPKTNKGKWLKAEIAHWRKDGWVIHCDYRGLMTRDEVRL